MLLSKDTATEKPEKMQGWIQFDNRFKCLAGQPDINRADLALGLESKTDWPILISWEEATPSANIEYLGSLYKSGIEANETGETKLNICEAVGYNLELPYSFHIRLGDTRAVSNLWPEREEFYISWPVTFVSDQVKLPENLESRLERIGKLPENWDSYSASRISSKAIEKARSIIIEAGIHCGLQLLNDTFVAPCSDGGIQLEFSSESEKELIIKISSNGRKASFLLSAPSGKEREKEGTITGQENWNSVLDSLCNKWKSLR